VKNFGHSTAVNTELTATMYAIEKAGSLNMMNIWLESDSLLNIICSHIPREGNQVAYTLAKNGHGFPNFTSQWWNDPPLFLVALLFCDSITLP